MNQGHVQVSMSDEKRSRRKRKSRGDVSLAHASTSAEWPNVAVQQREHQVRNSMSPRQQQQVIYTAQGPSTSAMPSFVQPSGMAYLTQQQALLNALAQGNQLFAANSLPSVGWPPGPLPMAQAAGLAAGLVPGNFPHSSKKLTVASTGDGIFADKAIVAPLHYPLLSSKGATWEDGGTTEQDTSCSSSARGVTIPDGGMTQDLTDLCLAVGAQALELIPDTSGRISTKSINWERVAASFPSLSPKECKRTWKRRFRKHKLARLPQGVILVCGSSIESPTLSQRGHRIYPQQGTSGRADGAVQRALSFQREPVGMNQSKLEVKRKVKRVKLTEAEEAMVEKMQKMYGNKWTYIAEKMETGRTGVEIKNYWHNLQHKIALRLLKEKQKDASSVADS